jgi:hypothetical protein
MRLSASLLRCLAGYGELGLQCGRARAGNDARLGAGCRPSNLRVAQRLVLPF